MREELVIGLVAEGPTDYEVIEPFVQKALTDIGFSGNLEFKRIQPELDQTSSTYPPAGWTKVMAWCGRFPPERREHQLFSPLFEDEKSIDLLVVQLDGDVLDGYANHCQKPLPNPPWTAEKRGEYVEGVLREWLWPDSNPAKPEKGHITLASIIATETWLVAGFDMALKQPEEVNPENELMRLRLLLPVSVRPGIKNGKLDKKPEKWRRMAAGVVGNLSHIRNVCPHCNKFLSQVESAI